MSKKTIRFQVAMHGRPTSRHASKERHGKTRPFQTGRELLALAGFAERTSRFAVLAGDLLNKVSYPLKGDKPLHRLETDLTNHPPNHTPRSIERRAVFDRLSHEFSQLCGERLKFISNLLGCPKQ